MISLELEDIEIELGLLSVPFKPEKRNLWVSPMEVLCARALASMFDLTTADERRLRQKAQRLEMALIARGR